MVNEVKKKFIAEMEEAINNGSEIMVVVEVNENNAFSFTFMPDYMESWVDHCSVYSGLCLCDFDINGIEYDDDLDEYFCKSDGCMVVVSFN